MSAAASSSYPSKRHFPSLPTVASKRPTLNVLPPGVISMMTSDRGAGLLGSSSPLGSSPVSKKTQMQDIAKEALRLTRETLKDSSKSTKVVAGGTGGGGEKRKVKSPTSPTSPRTVTTGGTPSSGVRLNKFVRRLHDMLQSEKDSGIVEWRRGLLVLHSTDAFAKQILPKYFNTRNFKTFRRQLNYYGFVHVRSFSTTGTATTALWVNRDLAQTGSDDISSVLKLRRVEPCETAKTTEGRRVRKELAIHTVEEDLGVSAKTLQMEQIRSLAQRGSDPSYNNTQLPVPTEIHCRERRRSSSSLDDSSTLSPGHHSPTADVVTESSDEESAANLLLCLSKAGY